MWGRCVVESGGLSHWRDLLGKYPQGELVLIGFSKDYDVKAARTAVRTEGIDWPQVYEGKGWADSVFHLYNVRGVPWTDVIDRDGRIVCKRKRGEELEEELDALLLANSS